MQSTPRSNSRPKHRNILSYLLVLIPIGLSAFIWLNHQLVLDTVSFWRYQPTTEVAQIATRDDLTDHGKFLFYADAPRVDGSATFNNECQRKESGTAILGCYVNDRIYIYDVTDVKLDGIKEVTAAHELLHAAYQRMSSGERKTVNKLVEAEYTKLQNDPDYADRMAFYARTEPGERDNELHSIIGTEIALISPALEAHYSKYFNNRGSIVHMFEAYNNTFTTLSDRAKSLAAQLDALSKQIQTTSNRYNADVKQLNADIAAFNQRAKKGSFSSQAEFDNERQGLVSRTGSVADERNAINSLVDRYNGIRGEYNSIVTQSNSLYQSIDSSLAPAPKI